MYYIEFLHKIQKAKKRAINEIKNEKDSMKLYGYKRLLEEGEDANKLFKY